MIKKPFTGKGNKNKLVLLGTSLVLSATLIAPTALAATTDALDTPIDDSLEEVKPDVKPKADETVPDPEIDLPVRVIVNYVDEQGNKLAPSTILKGDVGGGYYADEREFDGYKLLNTAGSKSGFMTETPINVTYMYLKTEGSTTPNVPVDKTAPAQPNVADVPASAKFITGSAEAGSVVTVTFPNNVTNTTVAGPNGAFSVTVPADMKLTTGASLAVTARDSAGNVSVARTMTVVADSITLDDNTSMVRVNVSFVDQNGKTLAPAVGLSGKVGESYKTLPFDIVGYELVGNTGNTTGTMSKNVSNVTYQYKPVTAVDPNKDTTAPDAPKLSEFVDGNVAVVGTAEARSTVTVTFPNGRVVTETLSGGSFSIAVPSGITLKSGDKVTATATDASGNVSKVSTLTVVAKPVAADTEAPAQPVVESLVIGSKTITGSAEVDSKVMVKFPNGVTATTTAKAASVKTAATGPMGVFSVDIPNGVTLKAGDAVVITSADAAGNVSPERVVRVAETSATPPPAVTPTPTPGDTNNNDDAKPTPKPTPSGDVTAPEPPVVDQFVSDGKTVVGEAEPGALIKIVFDNGTVVSTTANADGKFRAEIPAEADFKVGGDMALVAIDEAGNMSDPTVMTYTSGTGYVKVPEDELVPPGATPTPAPSVTAPPNANGKSPIAAPTTSPRAGEKAPVDAAKTDAQKERELKAIPQASAETNWWMIAMGLLSVTAAGFLGLKRREKPVSSK